MYLRRILASSDNFLEFLCKLIFGVEYRVPITHCPKKHMSCLRRKTTKIPEIIMGRLRLRNFSVWFWFSSVNDVGKFNCILNEEYRDIIPDKIPVSFTGIE